MIFVALGDYNKDRLDGLMEQFKATQPDFYNAYHAPRAIIDTGHRKQTSPPAPPPNP